MQVRVASVDGLAHGQALKFEFERDGEACEGFVLRSGDALFAYHNRCPHLGIDLDMGEGRFYSALTDRIFCSSHGALFVPSSGYCDAGPCAGEALERFGLELDGVDAVITIPDVG
ncbi:Iron-sulfur cluster-binding protein, Rieske family protein [Enhygromyxa salina]|uniref:Iron-sulfur cluster-binding protein, Rieske family protein n=1 Tax=Enhygromyxa salina TaxID=215803 RepID=A0A0C1ZME3_9BACT|nr:Rieske 2Fe-2S domain-containing protein [Enhygromyxa salina]KIG12138.1 Iron-sulfur cluster-binding protein, Rieske family protein [Enhygromyxa salina]